MNTCTFIDSMQAIRPWLKDNSIKRAYLNDKGKFTITFIDGDQRVYQVDECTEWQLDDLVELMNEHGVQVSK